MKEAIAHFAEQFAYEPVVENEDKLLQKERYILAGMGGSHLAADLLLTFDEGFDIVVHEDYGLPVLGKKRLEQSLFIASSYSGNTEEVLNAYAKAKEKNVSAAAISIGGELIEQAKQDGIPYIQMPDKGIQPRSALGFSMRALLKLLGKKDAFMKLGTLASSLNPREYEEQGKQLAEELRGKVPVIYSSRRNRAIAYNWKIKFNETGKIPAFFNVFPELNHNEMQGFDIGGKIEKMGQWFSILLLEDEHDSPQIKKRMEVVANLYKERNLDVKRLPLKGEDVFLRMFSSLILADWASYYTATGYDREPEQVPMVESFKQRIVRS